MCSTPFGVTEIGIYRRNAAPDVDHASAQRLSASLRSAYGTYVEVFLAFGRCSTPFGVTEIGIFRPYLRQALTN